MVAVFTDLSPDRAKEFFDDVLQDLAVPSSAEETSMPRLIPDVGRGGIGKRRVPPS
jgi:hypothetical protein